MISRLVALLAVVDLTGFVVAGCSGPATGRTEGDLGTVRTQPSVQITVLTSGMTLNNKWELTYFKNSRNEDCIAVNYGGASSLPECSFEVNDRYPIDAAIQQMTPQVAVIYGEVAHTIANVEVAKGLSIEQPSTFVQPNSGPRCFVVLAVNKDVKDIYVNTSTGRASLKEKLSEFYTPG